MPKNPYARPDAKTLEAKAKGYPARSVFKLQEIDERWRLLKPGQRVLDLGAAPGSWSMYAAEKVGARGKVIGVDLQEIVVPQKPNLEFLQADVLGPTLPEQVLAAAPYDLVLSDMAPNTTGNKGTDQARSFELFMRALDVAARSSKPGGGFVGKIFMSGDFPEAKKAVAARYETCRILKPEGTRANSTEVFVVGTGRRRD
jgi:23S rRNA (uridine2552-2'-O)-methyltransferase